MATRRIQEFLDGNHARYVTIRHSPAYTAQEVAESTHIPGRAMAKTVVVRCDQRLAIAVVPASREVDMARLRSADELQYVELAEEADFVGCFEGCQLGAAPPFGNLFGMDTYVDRALAREQYIAFNAGTHTDVIVMRFDDYRRLAHPKVVDISLPATAEVG